MSISISTGNSELVESDAEIFLYLCGDYRKPKHARNAAPKEVVTLW